MGHRRKARIIALQVLYQWDLTGEGLEEASDPSLEGLEGADDTREFAEDLIRGVKEHREEIDHLVQGCSDHWRMERMALVDRNILRLAVYELLYHQDIPERVTINEAIELGKRFSTEESGAFINGVLDQIRILHRPRAAEESS